MPRGKLGFQLVGAHAIAAYQKKPSTQIWSCTAGPLRKIPRIHNCTKTWHVWMTDEYISFVKLSNFSLPNSSLNVPIIHGHSKRRLQPFRIATYWHLSHWGVGHSAEYLRLDPRCPIPRFCTYWHLLTFNLFQEISMEFKVQKMSFCLCAWCVLIHIISYYFSTPLRLRFRTHHVQVWSSMISVISMMISMEETDPNICFLDLFSQNFPWPRWCNLPSQ